MSEYTAPPPAAKRGSTAAKVLAALAVLALILGLVATVLGAVSATRLSSVQLTGFVNGQVISVPEDGLSVYTRDPGDRSSARCTLTGPDGESTVLDSSQDGVELPVNGQSFAEIATSPEGLAAEDYTAECTGVDGTTYAGPRAFDTFIALGLGIIGIVIGVGLLILALILGIVALLLRRKKASRPHASDGPGTDDQANPYHGPPPPGSRAGPYTAPPAGNPDDPYAAPPRPHREEQGPT